MGRGFMVEEAVERYLSSLCSSAPLTGLLVGQSSAQRDFVVMATRTPQREESSRTPGSSLDQLDMEWITEHARQVSRMLPGGLTVLGVFYISDAEAKDTLISLRQLVFAVQKSICRDFLWVSSDDDITERVTLHKRNVKHTLQAQILTTPVCAGEQGSSQVMPCGGRVMLRGAVHTRAYLHGNKPKAKLAEKVLKRDLVSTVSVRVQMVLEELMTTQENQDIDRLSLPRRVLFPLQGVCVCDYQFGDEGLGEVVERLKEILDVDAPQEDLDTTQEVDAVTMETQYSETEHLQVAAEAPLEPQKKNYFGIAMATVVTLLATGVSLLYLGD
ncbi:unnamed protein product [Merluccius merluccius]